MKQETTEAIRKALVYAKHNLELAGQESWYVSNAIAIINAESKVPVGIKSAQEWANEIAPRNPDGSFDWVQFIRLIQKDALACALNASPERVKETGDKEHNEKSSARDLVYAWIKSEACSTGMKMMMTPEAVEPLIEAIEAYKDKS